ncbi:hypothetical protein GCM10007424_08430 [Flavobacterium suaedae]|uniref:Aspartate/homoserine dehydrogenase NAD-binding domain-containing protein n=1 Tax=Flavobacterium suaedae TaxID=1767027 RepID=A0ABQ1JNE2_9FLAO|nr:hypothetical protein [Flavobacterium suaedae]GGB70763.1 hypothetical protein GCM10007424_08430 [Flavobacterium suaedae]
MISRINIVLFGIGNAGSALIDKVVKNNKTLVLERKLDIRFPIITNSTVAFYEKEGVNYSWEANFIQFGIPFKMEDVLNFVRAYGMENLIAIDATASNSLPGDYLELVKQGFTIISINKEVEKLPDSFGKGVKFLAESRDLEYEFVKTEPNDKVKIAEKLYETVLKVAERQKSLTL